VRVLTACITASITLVTVIIMGGGELVSIALAAVAAGVVAALPVTTLITEVRTGNWRALDPLIGGMTGCALLVILMLGVTDGLLVTAHRPVTLPTAPVPHKPAGRAEVPSRIIPLPRSS
jgi:hypothetical protein